jgi:hypothetical protein
MNVPTQDVKHSSCNHSLVQLFFIESFFSAYLLENDFVKNKPAIRCSFSYFSVLFSKAFFILLHRRCDKLSLFQGQAQRSK